MSKEFLEHIALFIACLWAVIASIAYYRARRENHLLRTSIRIVVNAFSLDALRELSAAIGENSAVKAGLRELKCVFSAKTFVSVFLF